ncbi:MAG TPA: hypothetical protein VD814_12030 [Nocardioides sp.]|nr:hypothetical protein [Nocardioides sp.]
MTDDDRERPTPSQPLNASRRPVTGPLLGLVAVLAALAVLFLLITWARYNT